MNAARRRPFPEMAGERTMARARPRQITVGVAATARRSHRDGSSNPPSSFGSRAPKLEIACRMRPVASANTIAPVRNVPTSSHCAHRQPPARPRRHSVRGVDGESRQDDDGRDGEEHEVVPDGDPDKGNEREEPGHRQPLAWPIAEHSSDEAGSEDLADPDRERVVRAARDDADGVGEQSHETVGESDRRRNTHAREQETDPRRRGGVRRRQRGRHTPRAGPGRSSSEATALQPGTCCSRGGRACAG